MKGGGRGPPLGRRGCTPPEHCKCIVSGFLILGQIVSTKLVANRKSLAFHSLIRLASPRRETYAGFTNPMLDNIYLWVGCTLQNKYG